MTGPGHAPFLQQRRAVPLAHLLAEALRANLAHRQHDMRVRLGLPVLAHVPMYIHVRDHAAFDELPFDKIAGEKSEEHTSELQSLMRISYAVICLKKKKKQNNYTQNIILIIFELMKMSNLKSIHLYY